jgi:hypothetical protein
MCHFRPIETFIYDTIKYTAFGCLWSQVEYCLLKAASSIVFHTALQGGYFFFLKENCGICSILLCHLSFRVVYFCVLKIILICFNHFLGRCTCSTVVRFQILPAAIWRWMNVFWDVAPCRIDRCFGGVYCLHHQGDESWWWRQLSAPYSTILLEQRTTRNRLYSSCPSLKNAEVCTTISELSIEIDVLRIIHGRRSFRASKGAPKVAS